MATHTIDTAGSGFGPFAAKLNAMNRLLARNWWLVLVRGILGVGFGLIALVYPRAAVLSLVWLYSAYLLVDGIFSLVAAAHAIGKDEKWGMLMFLGILSLATSAVAFLWPGITILVFVLLTASWAIISGFVMLVAAFNVDTGHGRWWLVLAGAASLIFGVLLFLTPGTGALVLAWWLGAYALVFGATLIVLSFQLRKRRPDHPDVEPAEV